MQARQHVSRRSQTCALALSGCDEQVLYVRVCVCLCVCLLSVIRLLVSDDTTKCDHASCFSNVCVCVCVLVCLAFGANVLGVQCIALCASIAFSLFCFFFVQCVHTYTRNNVCTFCMRTKLQLW